MDGKMLASGVAGAAVLALLLKRIAMNRGGRPSMTKVPDSTLAGLFQQTRASYKPSGVSIPKPPSYRAKPKKPG